MNVRTPTAAFALPVDIDRRLIPGTMRKSPVERAIKQVFPIEQASTKQLRYAKFPFQEQSQESLGKARLAS